MKVRIEDSLLDPAVEARGLDGGAERHRLLRAQVWLFVWGGGGRWACGYMGIAWGV